MLSCICPHIGHILVDGKNLSITRTLGLDISFLLSVPSAELCTSFPKSPLCHPFMFSSYMTMSFLPVTISWYAWFAIAFLLLESLSYSLWMSLFVSCQPLEPFFCLASFR